MPATGRSIALLLAVAWIGLSGCGGGSSNNGGNNNGGGGNNQNPSSSTVAGTVSDISGSSIVGSTVRIGNQTVTTTQFGTYTIPDVIVPAGENSVVTTITAQKTLTDANGNSHDWSGQNTVEVLRDQAFTSNTHIILSETATQGSITGTVKDTLGNPLVGARVFAGALDPNDPRRFTNLSSFTAYTDASGRYTLSKLPPLTAYTVTASFAGFINQTASVPVRASTQESTNFTLAASTTSAKLPVVNNLAAISITMPTTATRAANASRNQAANETIKRWIYAKLGLSRKRAADAAKITRKRQVTRDWPAGYMIENDLFWDYEKQDNLFGYDVVSSINDVTHFFSIATLRDPLADRFSDIDTVLTPNTTYFYSVARLDTIRFPNGDFGSQSDPADPVATSPLGAISLTAPVSGASVSTTPTLSWNAVNRATLYQVLVYDRFPDFPSDTDIDGVRPIWPQDQAHPGTSLVQAPNTSVVYQGPALTPGKTYYWAVLAQDDVGSAFTISPVQSFVAH